MPVMRNHKFSQGEFYHIYAHSVGDLKIFNNQRDCDRFLTVLFAANGEKSIPNISTDDNLNLVWDMENGNLDQGKPLVDIVCFCLMPTHFHLLLGETGNSKISKYVHKLMVSHSKFFNKKYERRGHLFESTFNSKHIINNEQLLVVSSYIHKNSSKIREWKNKEVLYPWSSYQDFVKTNRWGHLLNKNIIEDQFKNPKEYQNFIDEHVIDDELNLV